MNQEWENQKFRVYALVAVVLYAVIFLLKVFEVPSVYKYCIPLYVGVVFLYSLSSNLKETWLVSLALFFALVADSVINLTSSSMGVVIFCATHLCLITYYLRKRPFRNRDIILLVPILVIGILYCLKFFTAIPTVFLKFGIPVYMGILSVMVWRAICLFRDKERFKIIIGSVLFYLTDVAIILELIYGDLLILVVVAWLAYPPALFMLSLIGKYPQKVGSTVKA